MSRNWGIPIRADERIALALVPTRPRPRRLSFLKRLIKALFRSF